MEKILSVLTTEMQKIFQEAGYEPKFGGVVYSNRGDLCDFQCNGLFEATKKYNKAPFLIAEDIIKEVKNDLYIEKIEFCRPGFLNIKLLMCKTTSSKFPIFIFR